MLAFYKVYHLFVDFSLGLGRTGQGSVAAQILIGYCLQSYHVEIRTHTVAGDHCPCQFGCLFDIVGSACGGRVKYQFLRSPSSGKSGDLILQFFLAHQVVVAFFYLHGIAKSAGSTGNNGDLLDRSRICLLCCHQSMSDLVICHHFLFLICEDGIFLLITGDDYLNTFLQISLCHIFPVIPHRAESSFIYNISQFRTGSAGSHPGDFFKIDIIAEIYFLCMNPEDSFSSLKIRQFYRHPAVKSSRTGKRRIQTFRTVGSRQDHNSGIFFKAVHLCKELVQCLFPFVVTSCTSITFLANGVDLIDKYDTRSFFFSLFEKITDLRGSHAYEHFHKFRTGHGEKWHSGFPCHGFRQHGLTCSRRAYQKDPFGHGGADFFIFIRIVEIVYDLREIFFGFVFPCHIRKTDPFRGFYIYFGIAFPHTKGHGIGPSGIFYDLSGNILADKDEDHDGKDPAEKNA